MSYYIGKTSVNEVIGLIISHRRKLLNISQGNFANLLGLSNSSLSKIESGQTVLNVENLFLVLSLLRLTLDEFNKLLKAMVRTLQTEHKIYVYNPKDLNQDIENI
jgi:transcriptional regulator with XRE-family HTH domain